MKTRTIFLCAALSLLPSAVALAQVEVPMTPTPTPVPGMAPIPNYPEKSGSSSGGSSGSGKIRIDRSGMFGAGFTVGNTSTGAAAKFWMTPEVAVQGSLGGGPLGNDYRFRLDLLYSFSRWEEPGGTYLLPFYVGLGVQYGVFSQYPAPADGNLVGLRVPVGMCVVIPDNPVELFFEVAPDIGSLHYNNVGGVAASDHGLVTVDGSLGVRYYF
jgi:hypothetical protein